MARDIDGGRAVVEVDAELDQKSVRQVARELKASLSAADTTFKTEAQLSKQSVAQVRRELKEALTGLQVNIGVSVTKKSLADLRRSISQTLEKAFQIDVSVSKANLATIKAQIKAVLREDTNVGVRVAAKDLAAIRAAIKAAVPKNEKVKVDVDASQFDKLATRIGRIFGRGARNNFFNLTGILIEGTVRGLFRLGDAFSAVTKFATKFGELAFDAMKNVGLTIQAVQGGLISVTDGFRNASNAAGQFTAGLAGSISNLPQLIATLATLAVAFVAVAVVAGPLVAVLYSLAGAALAVGTAFTGALVGGAVVVVAAFAPLLAILGSLAAAWALMVSKQKDAFKLMLQEKILNKIKGTLKEASDILIKGMGPSLDKVGDALAKFRPAILGVATSVNKLGKEIANSLDSPEFQRFQKSVNEELPEDALKLGRILSDTFGGFGGSMVAVQPAVDQFLARLGGAAQEFNNFANSPKGQKSMSDFFLQAETALGSVGRLIKSTGALFANMFKGAAGDEGIALIDSFTGKLEDLNEFIKNNPEKVKKFFEGASEVARDVGDAIVVVTTEIGNLNTAANRDTAKLFFEAFVAGVKVAVFPLRLFASMLERTTELLGAVLEGQGKLSGNTALQDFGRDLRNFGDDVKLTSVDVKFLTNDLANLKLKGGFKLNADSSTITVATDRAKKLLIESGILARYPEIKIKVDPGPVITTRKELQAALAQMDKLDGASAHVSVSATLDQGFRDLMRAASFGLVNLPKGTLSGDVDARGGIMQGGRQLIGGEPMKFATGGIVSAPTFFGNVLAGEAGPEAIVPLRRRLSQVDPSVRELSAIAQGKGGGDTINNTSNYNFFGPESLGQARRDDDWAKKYGGRFTSATSGAAL